jgi:N utilization substance protein B
MQSVYAHQQDTEKTLDRLEKTMLENINSSYRAFLFNFYVLCKTAEYVNTDVQLKAVKHIRSDADRILSVSIFHNPIIQHLLVKEELYKEIQREKLDTKIDSDLFRQWFQLLSKSDEYLAYSKKENPLLTDDREIVTFLYRKILCANELFQQQIEDVFHTWNDDREIIFHAVLNFIETVPPDHDPFLIKQSKDQKELKQFATSLLKQTIIHEQETEETIVPFLKNWDKERLAMLDLLLLKMALIELLYFPEIPIKVSINEYIDLAKLYSTPKSGEFINGVLDAVHKRFIEEGKINKTGRGKNQS